MQFNARSTVAGIALMAVAACLPAGEAVAQNPNLVIGLLVPPEEPQAASLRDGATLGVELANQSPGPQVRLVIRGRTGQWGADGVEAARMVTDDGALGLIAPPDGAASHLVLQVSGRTAVPVITLSANSSVSQTGVPWMARIVPRTIEEAKTLFTRIPARHWTAVVCDGRGGRESARDLGEAATNSGRTLEKIIVLNPSFTNLARLRKKILADSSRRRSALAGSGDGREAGESVANRRFHRQPGRAGLAARGGLFLVGGRRDGGIAGARSDFGKGRHSRFSTFCQRVSHSVRPRTGCHGGGGLRRGHAVDPYLETIRRSSGT